MCGAGGMGCEAGVGIQMGSAEVTFLISLSIFYRLFRPCTLCSTTHPLPTHAQLTLCRLIPSSTHSVYTNPLEPPPQREGIRGCPLQTCPLPHLFCSAIMFSQSQQQNGRSRKKNGKKGEKRLSISLQSSTWATFID